MTAPTEAVFRAAIEASDLELDFEGDDVNQTTWAIELLFPGDLPDAAFEIWRAERDRVGPALQAAVRPLLVDALIRTALRWAAEYPDAVGAEASA